MRGLEGWRLQRLMKGPPRFGVHFSRGMLASCLWDFGEDELAERALALSDDELLKVQGIAAYYEEPSYDLPVQTRVTHRHVMAQAAVTFAEGRVRPLARVRRRPEEGPAGAVRPDRAGSHDRPVTRPVPAHARDIPETSPRHASGHGKPGRC